MAAAASGHHQPFDFRDQVDNEMTVKRVGVPAQSRLCLAQDQLRQLFSRMKPWMTLAAVSGSFRVDCLV